MTALSNPNPTAAESQGSKLRTVCSARRHLCRTNTTGQGSRRAPSYPPCRPGPYRVGVPVVSLWFLVCPPGGAPDEALLTLTGQRHRQGYEESLVKFDQPEYTLSLQREVFDCFLSSSHADMTHRVL